MTNSVMSDNETQGILFSSSFAQINVLPTQEHASEAFVEYDCTDRTLEK